MRSNLLAPLALLPLLASGCTTTLSRLGGEDGPFDLSERQVTYRELGSSGADRLLQRTSESDLLWVRGDKSERVRGLGPSFRPLDVQVLNDRILYRQGERLLSRALGSSLGREREVLALPGLRRFLLTPAGLFVADADTLFRVPLSAAGLPRPSAKPEPFLDALVDHLAWDARREQLWVTQREPFAVVEAFDPTTAASQTLIPLPLELEGGGLEVLFSGESVAIYAHDRPLQVGMILRPETDHVWRLLGGGETRAAGEGQAPRVLTPPGTLRDGRVSLSPPQQPVFGRLAPFGANRVLVVDDAPTIGGPSVSVVTVSGDDAPPACANRPLDADWPRAVQGVSWDSEGVTLIAQNHLLRITEDDAKRRRIHADPGPILFRALNVVIAAPITLVETAGVMTFNAATGAVALVCSPVVLAAGEPEIALYMSVSPIWLTFGTTFGYPEIFPR